MGQTMDQMKMLNQLRKAQKDLKNEIVEVEAGDGAVVVQITGELKVKKVTLDPEKIDLDDIEELERWIENCFRDGYAKAQEIATEKMKPLMSSLGGALGNMGMQLMLPKALDNVIDALGKLPGVGPRTAERYAYYLFRSNENISKNIAESLSELHERVKSCPKTFALIDSSEEISPLYTDEKRDKKTILVVEEPLDIYAIEQTKAFSGTYHVLGGALSPIDGITPEQLHIKELVSRIEEDAATEIIIATNPSVEGESTALLLQKTLSEKFPELKITRLARGLPLGVDLSYADQITLSAALNNRTDL